MRTNLPPDPAGRIGNKCSYTCTDIPTPYKIGEFCIIFIITGNKICFIAYYVGGLYRTTNSPLNILIITDYDFCSDGNSYLEVKILQPIWVRVANISIIAILVGRIDAAKTIGQSHSCYFSWMRIGTNIVPVNIELQTSFNEKLVTCLVSSFNSEFQTHGGLVFYNVSHIQFSIADSWRKIYLRGNPGLFGRYWKQN